LESLSERIVLQLFFSQLMNDSNIDSQSESIRLERAQAFKETDYKPAVCA